MAVVLYGDATVCAAFVDSAGDAPISDPLSHLDKVKFHSSLDYVEFDQSISGSITFPSRSFGSVGVATYPVLAHGRGVAPMVVASCTISGNDVPLAGFVPIQTAGSGGLFRRSIFVSSDATYVSIGESYIARGPASATVEFPAVTVAYTIYLAKRSMPYAAPTYTGDQLYLSATRAIMGRGRFDASKKYFRAESSGAALPYKGRTETLYVAGVGVSPFYNMPQWGFKCGSYEINSSVNASAGFSPGAPTRITA